MSTESLIELAEFILKITILNLMIGSENREGTTKGTKFAPPYAITFMAALENEILE